MGTVGTIAFRGQFQACFNGAFELKCELRRECWVGWEGALGQGRTSRADFYIWDSYKETKPMRILYEAGSASFWGESGVFTHAPPLQETGHMLTRSIRNRIQSRDGTRICRCWCIAVVVCVRNCVNLRIFLRGHINAWVTDPCVQLLSVTHTHTHTHARTSTFTNSSLHAPCP